MAWADVAKGVCILLVVLHHVIGKHLEVVGADGTAAAAAWVLVDESLKPLRMPLFFLLSGTFAAGALRRPWPQVWRKKVAAPYWTFLVWTAVQVPVFAFVATRIRTHRAADVAEVLGELLLAATGLWYLYGLAIYFVLAKLLVRVPVWVTLPMATAVSVAASWLPVEGVNRMQLVQCFVFFAVGAYLPGLLSRLPQLPRRGMLVLAAGYLAAAAAAAGSELRLSVVMLALAPVAVPLAAQAAMRLGAVSVVGPRLADLGLRTLPVYVLHMPLLGLLHQAVTGTGAGLPAGWPTHGGAGTLTVVVYPVLVTAAVTVGSLAAHRLLCGIGAGWLFRLPRQWSGTEGSARDQGRRTVPSGAPAGPARTGAVAGLPGPADRRAAAALGAS